MFDTCNSTHLVSSATNFRVVLRCKLQVQFATWTVYLNVIIPGINASNESQKLI